MQQTTKKGDETMLQQFVKNSFGKIFIAVLFTFAFTITSNAQDSTGGRMNMGMMNHQGMMGGHMMNMQNMMTNMNQMYGQMVAMMAQMNQNMERMHHPKEMMSYMNNMSSMGKNMNSMMKNFNSMMNNYNGMMKYLQKKNDLKSDKK